MLRPLLLVVIALTALTTGYAGDKKAKGKAGKQASGQAVVVNLHVGKPSHVLVMTTGTFSTKASVSAAYTSSDGSGVTGSFDGKVLVADKATKRLVIRLKCKGRKPAKAKDGTTTSGQLSVTLMDTCVCTETVPVAVATVDDPDACD